MNDREGDSDSAVVWFWSPDVHHGGSLITMREGGARVRGKNPGGQRSLGSNSDSAFLRGLSAEWLNERSSRGDGGGRRQTAKEQTSK